jgi:4-diphosphocytidyl-2-C-methyl-D-erythritol kinase
MPQVEIQAFPKVNLFLHVTGKREDGYHLLDSLVVFPKGIADAIRVSDSDALTLNIDGTFSTWLQVAEENLVRSAFHRFPKRGHAGVKIDLEKNIPIGAGLGGGSADAAATIHALEQLYGKKLEKEERDRILLSLGADVPVCYEARPCRLQGIGEIITPWESVPSFYIALVWPGVPSHTKNVFAAYDRHFTVPLPELPIFSNQNDFLEFLDGTGNDLAQAAEKTCPVITEARTVMQNQKGCLLSRMTGSGSCVFGLFMNEAHSKDAAEALADHDPAWWARAGQF